MDLIALILLGLYLVFVATFTFVWAGGKVARTIVNLPVAFVLIPAMLGGLLAEIAKKKHEEIKKGGKE